MRTLPLLLLTACTASGADFGDPPAGADCDAVGLSPGDCVPDFTLTDTEGNDWTPSELRGIRLVIVGSSMW